MNFNNNNNVTSPKRQLRQTIPASELCNRASGLKNKSGPTFVLQLLYLGFLQETSFRVDIAGESL